MTGSSKEQGRTASAEIPQYGMSVPLLGRECNVKVRFPLYTHNPALKREVHDYYAHNRHVPMWEPIIEGLRLMVTRRDVENLIAKLRAEFQGEADGDIATVEVLVNFENNDSGNVVSVNETFAGETGAISLTTAHVRHLFAHFPKIGLVDSTHKTNSIMIMYAFGHGEFIQHSVIETNSD
ncbi:SUMO protease [Phytophthora megakarya]|uniref:SUMO protease n=1 Tax=Phytophthora megakarya TaxID=4795 RepID=A0A225WZM2_9STRA|nr:SUMO protease [Phytophthora megakarya]